MERRTVRDLICLAVVLLLLIMVPVLILGEQETRSHTNKPTPTVTLPTTIPPTATTIPPTRPTPRSALLIRSTPPAVVASIYYLVDMNDQHILAGQNTVKPVPMASTTKIMTALIAIESGNLNQPVTVHQDSLDRIAAGGSGAGLRLGDTLPLKDMLYALMLPSGDDAAWAIADTLAGSGPNFVQRMNLFAYHLHLFQTHYANPDGLSLTPEEDQQHYTTATDLARLTEYALSIPLFATIVQTAHYATSTTTMHAKYSWTNTNTLLTSYTGMLGVKTGFTYAAGYCLVFAAHRKGHELLGVVLHSSSEEQRNQDAITLLNWGFALPSLAASP